MHNKGNFIVSLGALCAWLAPQAEALGVDVFPGFAASEAVIDDHGRQLGTESFAAIGNELGQLYAALEGRDLAAGTAAARRLFS